MTQQGPPWTVATVSEAEPDWERKKALLDAEAAQLADRTPSERIRCVRLNLPPAPAVYVYSAHTPVARDRFRPPLFGSHPMDTRR